MTYVLTHKGIRYGKYTKEQLLEQISKLLDKSNDDEDYVFLVEEVF